MRIDYYASVVQRLSISVLYSEDNGSSPFTGSIFERFIMSDYEVTREELFEELKRDLDNGVKLFHEPVIVRISKEDWDKIPNNVPCLGEWTYNSDSHDFDCGYGASFSCEDCLCNGGKLDPRVDE